MSDVSTIGERVSRLRRQRHLTQSELAERAGVSADLIRKLEQGRRRSTRIGTLHKIAKVLDVQTSVLIDGPSPANPNHTGPGIAELRRVLAPGPFSPQLDDLPTPQQLRTELDAVWQLHQRGEYHLMARMIPDLVDAIRAVAGERPHDRSKRMLAEVYQLAAVLLLGVRAEDLCLVAVDRLYAAANAAGDPLSLARAADTWSWLLCRQGRLDDSQHVATKAADAVEPAKFTAATAEELSVWCGLLQRGVTIAARRDDGGLADDLLSVAGAAARRIGTDRNDQWTVSGPSNVAIHAVRAAVDLGEPHRALQLARDVPRSATLPPVWWTRHYLDVAHAQFAVKRDTQAVATLRRIEEITPGWLAFQGLAREMVIGMLRREPPSRIPGLRHVAERVGVDRASD